jgi:hypothetical protein
MSYEPLRIMSREHTPPASAPAASRRAGLQGSEEAEKGVGLLAATPMRIAALAPAEWAARPIGAGRAGPMRRMRLLHARR